MKLYNGEILRDTNNLYMKRSMKLQLTVDIFLGILNGIFNQCSETAENPQM